MSLALWAALPAVFGWTTTVVMSGSMAPAIFPGDAVVARPVPVDELRVGQIVLVPDPDHEGRLRLHRITAINGGQLTLRGDANVQPDSTPVAIESVIGVGALRIPAVGVPALLIHDGSWIAAGLLVGGMMVLMWLSGADTRTRDSEDDSVGLPVVWTTGLGILTTALLAFTALSPGSGATFVVATDSTPNSFGTIPYYTCDAAILASAPYFYYRFDETGGTTTATDSSGNGLNGNYRGGVTKNQPRACVRDTGTAIRVSGTTGVVRKSNNATITAPSVYSMEIWFQSTSTTGGRIMGFGNSRSSTSTNYDRQLYLTATGQVMFGANPGKTTIGSLVGGYNDGQWHHAVAVKSASGMSLYVDGVLQGSNTQAASQNYTGYWRIGWDTLRGWNGFVTGTTPALTAILDHAAVYTTALTATEVADHYVAGK